MDGRQMHNGTPTKHQQDTFPMDCTRPYGFQMAGGREHSILAIEGRYRCPHCRRLDTAEMSDKGISRR